jgi:hypothetical protein
MLPRSAHSYVVAEAAGIPCGIWVADAGQDQVRLPVAAGDITPLGVGFVHRDPTKGGTGAPQTVLYANGDPVTIMRKGYIWVIVENAVTAERPVFARHTASGANTQLGKVRADGDTGTADQVPSARFVTSTTGAGLAIVEVW